MAVSVTSGATYAIMNWGNGMILDSHYNATAQQQHRVDVCAAHIGGTNVPSNQEWVLSPTGATGEYTIKNVWDGLCVDLDAGVTSGSAMKGYNCQQGKASQKFVFTRIWTGDLDPKFCISNAASGLAVGATTTSTTGNSRCGFPVNGLTNSCNTDTKLQWQLWPLDVKQW